MTRSGNPEVREKIFAESMKQFLEKGYGGTVVSAITDALKISKGSFYWYFKSKEDMLVAIIRKWEKLFLDGLIEAWDKLKDDTALNKMRMYMYYNASFSYNNPELCVVFTTLASELVGKRRKNKVEKEIIRIYRRYQSILSPVVSQGIKEGTIKDDLDPGLASLLLIAFQDGILFQWFINKQNLDGKAYVDTFKKMIFKGILVDSVSYKPISSQRKR